MEPQKAKEQEEEAKQNPEPNDDNDTANLLNDETDTEEPGTGDPTGKKNEDSDKVKMEERGGPPDELRGLPVDRGWAWVILFASIFEIFIYGGIMKSYGVFFVQFQARFGSSASETVLVQTVSNIVISVSGIVVMTVGMKHMTARTSVCAGAVITCGAYLLAAYTTHLEVLIFALGGVAGVAVTMIYLPIISTVGIYFNKRRGLANSVTVAGASLGSLVFGPLYTLMFDYYGYSGTMLITAGLLMHILISGCLLRPPEFYTNRGRNRAVVKETEMTLLSNTCEGMDFDDDKSGDSFEEKYNGINETDDITFDTEKMYQDRQAGLNGSLTRTISEPTGEKEGQESPRIGKRLPHFAALNFQRTRALSFDPESSRDDAPPSPPLRRFRAGTFADDPKRTFSESSNDTYGLLDAISESKVALYSAADIMCASMASLNVAVTDTQEHVSQDISDEIECKEDFGKKTCLETVKAAIVDFLRTVFDMSLLRDPVFLHYVAFASVSLPASIMTNVYFIPFASDIGISNKRVGILLFVIGSVDLVSRVSVGVFADRKLLRSTTIITIGFLIMAIVNNFTRFIHSFSALLAFVIIQGSLSGVYLALYAVILVENLGIERFKASLGFTSMFHGVSVAIFFPITGALRDSSGAYYWTYHLLSILLIIGAVLAFTLPMTYRRIRKQPSETERDVT